MLNQSLFCDSLIEQEIKLETGAIDAGVRRYRLLAQQAVNRGDGAALKPAQRLMLHWYLPLVAEFKNERRMIQKGEPGKGRRIYGAYWMLLKPEQAAVIAMHETISMCMKHPNGVRVSKLAYNIGRAFFSEVNLQLLKKVKEDRPFPDNSGRTYSVNMAQELEKQVRNFSPQSVNWWAKKTLDDPIWERRASSHLGVRMLWGLLSVANLNDYNEESQFVPAFHHVRRVANGANGAAFIDMDSRTFDIIEDGHKSRQFLRPRYLPMIVAPYPWTDDTEGGYVKIRTPYISKPHPLQKQALEEADLSKVNERLNAVGATPWRINSPILFVMQQLWESGGNTCRLPRTDNIPTPPFPAGFDDEEAKARWKKDAFKIHKANKELKASRFNFLQILSIAKDYQTHDRFYFPHMLDFRGRVYPIPVGLNHQGDDVCRGLLEFADAKPVTEAGMWWLKVHAAGLYGIDGCSYELRLRWADDHMPQILESARNPLSTDFWQHADEGERGACDGKPWQFLAACMAIADPEHAGQHLPCQVDGTCNGLQHYAALGRDEEGAKYVNLIPANTPQDVYQRIADLIKPIVDRDAEGGLMEALAIADWVTRKVIKQNVMTKVYNVSPVGARKQVFEKLKNAGLENRPKYLASMYLSNLALTGVSQTCVSADRIMEWMKLCARLITQDKSNGRGKPKTKGVTVVWKTPLGFPVVQPYRKYSTKTISTILQELSIQVYDEQVDVAGGQQVDGVAPNFVHSIDSTHMFMTALACYKKDIAFAAVHDSYWSHACDMGRLSDILRDTFIELHSMDLLGDLREQWQALRPDVKLPLPPEPGNLDLSVVKHSRYIFS